jgi:hypothetical protein
MNSFPRCLARNVELAVDIDSLSSFTPVNRIYPFSYGVAGLDLRRDGYLYAGAFVLFKETKALFCQLGDQ